MKKILYPTKYEELIKLHGNELGEKEYSRFVHGMSLEKDILKYGEEEGTIIYNKKVLERSKKIKGNRLDMFIRDHGEERGKEMYESWKLKTSQSLDGFIRRYGEEEGKEKYEIFRNKNIENLSKMTRKNYNTRLSYWVDKYGEEEGKLKYKERQNTSSLNKLIKRYGKKEGKIKYIEINKKKKLSLENFIRKHGNERGIELFNKNIRKIIRNKGRVFSNIALEFCLSIENMVNKEHVTTYYGENEYIFYTGVEEPKIIFPDYYVKGNNISIAIEFYGDYWHRNPNQYKETEETNIIWKRDEKRINLLKEDFNCDCHIVWESDYRNNKESILNKFKEIFIGYGIYKYTGCEI